MQIICVFYIDYNLVWYFVYQARFIFNGDIGACIFWEIISFFGPIYP